MEPLTTAAYERWALENAGEPAEGDQREEGEEEGKPLVGIVILGDDEWVKGPNLVVGLKGEGEEGAEWEEFEERPRKSLA